MMRFAPIITSWGDLNMGARWIWEQKDWPKFSWDRGALADSLP